MRREWVYIQKNALWILDKKRGKNTLENLKKTLFIFSNFNKFIGAKNTTYCPTWIAAAHSTRKYAREFKVRRLSRIFFFFQHNRPRTVGQNLGLIAAHAHTHTELSIFINVWRTHTRVVHVCWKKLGGGGGDAAAKKKSIITH